MSHNLRLTIRTTTAGLTFVEKMMGDSVRLLNRGKSNQDERATVEARKLRLFGIKLLNSEVQHLRHPNSVVPAAQMLLLSEIFCDGPGELKKWTVWRSHLQAMAVMMKRGNKSDLRPLLLH